MIKMNPQLCFNSQLSQEFKIAYYWVIKQRNITSAQVIPVRLRTNTFSAENVPIRDVEREGNSSLFSLCRKAETICLLLYSRPKGNNLGLIWGVCFVSTLKWNSIKNKWVKDYLIFLIFTVYNFLVSDMQRCLHRVRAAGWGRGFPKLKGAGICKGRFQLHKLWFQTLQNSVPLSGALWTRQVGG